VIFLATLTPPSDLLDTIRESIDSKTTVFSLHCRMQDPSIEILMGTDQEILADSFFPKSDNQQHINANGFFHNASRGIFARLLESNPAPAELMRLLVNDEDIDRQLEGTELTQLVCQKTPLQRAGILSMLAEAGNKLRIMLQEAEAILREREPDLIWIMASRWYEHRQSLIVEIDTVTHSWTPWPATKTDEGKKRVEATEQDI
jgi:hypothetical protein